MSIPDRGDAGSTTDAVTTVTTVGYGDTFPLTLTAERGAPVVRIPRSMPDFDSLTVTQTARPLIGLPPRARAGVARSIPSRKAEPESEPHRAGWPGGGEGPARAFGFEPPPT